MSNFAFVFVPADTTTPIVERSGDKSGGLDRDALRLSAESHFSQVVPASFLAAQEKELQAVLDQQGVAHPTMAKTSAAGMVGSVEIVSLLLPCPDNNFNAVSMYCDQNGKHKNLPLNTRATSIARECGHAIEVYGDAFFGRCLDDESKPWERVDFSLADLSSEAPWVLEAKQRNKGKALGGYSTSGVLQNMLNSNKTAVVDDNAPQKTIGTDSVVAESDVISWTQTKEEMEVRVKLPVAAAKASEIDVKIHAKTLQVLLKSGQAIVSEADSGSINKIVRKGGAELYATVDPDCSAWTLEKTKTNEVVVVCTLAKNVEAQWPQLTK